jgi:pyruvate dehydrogenase E1 component
MSQAISVQSSILPPGAAGATDVDLLRDLERRVRWLSAWTIHHANHIRPNLDGLKVGGHQSSCASVSSLMTALYFSVLRPEDRVAVKPHAAPVYHAIQYLLGRQTRDQLERFRALGGVQSYPSRTKDTTGVDFSTGSVGLGVAATLFASLVQSYVQLHELGWDDATPGRMIALLGDAELDEGNVFEALLEGWKHDVRNVWWIIDYNRQSLDGVVNDALFQKIQGFFGNVGWDVTTLKYGRLLEAARGGPAGEALIRWIDKCPNQVYSALTFRGASAWRDQLQSDLRGTSGLKQLLDTHDDDALHRLMTNLGGHDLDTILEAFHGAGGDQPRCFVAYTIKGYGLPLAGHKDNHSGLMNPAQMQTFREVLGVPEGREWDPLVGMQHGEDEVRRFLSRVPVAARKPLPPAPVVPIPPLGRTGGGTTSTQEAFGKLLADIARTDSPLSRHLVTTSPDVTVSTNLSGWVNRRGVFHSSELQDVFRDPLLASSQKWEQSPKGQHIELGIAENNLFLLLGQLGLASDFFGARLLPVGTVYDPFINRGLDALIYACYQGARFIVVATPSGVTLAPEGGAHQSINTPLIGMAQDGLVYFEPAYADELSTVLEWGFSHLQAPEGGSVYLRLSTRALEQPQRTLEDREKLDVLRGAYWVAAPTRDTELALVYCGVVAPEVAAAHAALLEDLPGTALLAVTSPDMLYQDWTRARRNAADGHPSDASHIENLLAGLPPRANLVTVLDGHPATLAWLGSVNGHRVAALGVTHFGQSGDIPDLYRLHRIDTDAVLDAAASLLVRQRRGVMR